MEIFSRRFNWFPLILAVGGIGSVAAITIGIDYWFSPSFTQVGYAPTQPVPYSHRLHVRDVGLDCRYCHSSVERSPVAGVPPTQTCMNCHQLIKVDSPKLALVRESWDTGKRLEWTRVHQLAGYAKFDHSVHVTSGIGCSSCHGRIDEMDVVQQSQPLNMAWCLECHRDVRAKQGNSDFVRPLSEMTNMEWVKDPAHPTTLTRKLDPPENCSSCHY